MMSSSLYFSKRLIGQNVVEVIQPETRNQKPSDYYQKNLHHFSLIGRNPSNCHCPISFLQLPSEKAIRQSRQTTGESTPGRPMPTHQTEKKKKKTLSRRTSQHSHRESINQIHQLQHIQSRRKRRGRRTHLPDRWTNGWTDGWRASAAVRRCDQIFHIYSRVASQPHLLFKEKTTSSDQSDGRTPPEISGPAARRGRGLFRPGPEPLRYKRQESDSRRDSRRQRGSITGNQIY